MSGPVIAANCSILFTEVPLLDRARAAADAGLSAVEFWWPFDTPTPSAAAVGAFVRSVEQAGVRLVALNVYAGDMPGGERGVLSHADRRPELLASLDAVVEIAAATGVGQFNALYGRPQEGVPARTQWAAAVDGVVAVAERLAPAGTVLLEAVSGVPGFALRTFEDCLALRDAARDRGAAGLAILADLYHLTVNGVDVDRLIADHVADIAHVQVADLPGRHEPGTGDLPLAEWLRRLSAGGYTGAVGLEYVPRESTAAGLAAGVAALA